MADAVQNPGGRRPGTAIAFRGEQGCGKSILVNNFGKIFGTHYMQLASSHQLTGRFNDHLKSAILVFADEAVWGGDKAAEGKIKALITEPTLFVEPKGINGFRVSNHIRLMLASNNDWVVPAGFKERRFLVVDVSSAKINDYEYFKAIEEQMANGGLENLLYYLLQVDLSKINLQKIPRTRALFDQIASSMTPFQKFWYDRLMDGELFSLAPHQGSGNYIPNIYAYPAGWPDEVKTDDLFKEFSLFCQNQNIHYRKSKTEMGGELKKMKISKPRQSSGDRKYFYVIPPLEVCRNEFEKLVGDTIQWDSISESEDERPAAETSLEVIEDCQFTL
jgi:hypothetical protein